MLKKLAGMLTLLMLLLTACGTTQPVEQVELTPPLPEEVETVPNVSSPAVQQIQGVSVQLSVFYADAELTELVEEQRGLPYHDESDKYKEAMKLLGEPAEEGHQALWKDFKYHDITFEEGMLTIDAVGSNTYNYGSTGELFAIEALKQTFFQFPEIEQIRILVDGKAVESLMGHVDILEPLTR